MYILKNKIIFSFFSFVVFFWGCNKENIIYSDYYSFYESTWSHNDSVIFNLELNDTSSVYNVFFQLRANTSYKWSNIYIFSDIFFPNGKARRDTFEFYLADEKGHWVGDRSGLIVEYSFPIYKNVRFPLSGDYKFHLQQAMRDTVLNEISNVGLKISKPLP